LSTTKLEKVLNSEEILQLQEIVRKIPITDYVVDYAVKIVRSTRPKDKLAPDFVKKWVNWGASPRASQTIVLAAKAKAVLSGRLAVSIDDVRSIVYPALRHRIILNFHAEAEGITSNEIIKLLLETIEPEQPKVVRARQSD
jgi:MoxR-like ATPase